MVICLEQGADDLHTVQLKPLPPHHLLLQQNPEWFILLVPAYPGCPGKMAVKRLCVCVCYIIKFCLCLGYVAFISEVHDSRFFRDYGYVVSHSTVPCWNMFIIGDY